MHPSRVLLDDMNERLAILPPSGERGIGGKIAATDCKQFPLVTVQVNI